MTTFIRVFLCLALFFCLSPAADGASTPEEIIPMLGCRACHLVDGKGGQIGPNLSGIGQRMTRQELQRILLFHNDTNPEHPMPRYDYLFESERQQLLNILEQQ